MNKIMIMGILVTTVLYSFDAEVKKASVSLLINEQNRDFKVGEKFTLNTGDLVCFVKGDGRVVVVGENYKKQLSKRNKSCKHLPSDNGRTIEYSQMLKHSVVSIFEKSKEKSTDGVSRKSLENNTLTAPIYMGVEAKYLAVENSTWGPLPVMLKIYDTNGLVVDTMTNEEDVITSFILPRNMLKEGYSLKVSNVFDDLLMDSKIHFQTVQK